MSERTTAVLRRRLQQGTVLAVPGAANALTARMIVEAGFEAVYVTGAGIANTFLGKPDIGLVTLTELAMHVAAIRDAVDVPLIVDGDTGFGNAISVRRTVRELERAGADAIQIEDQQFPKKCGHFSGKQLITTAEMMQKVHAATDARADSNLLIVARTDARASEGFEAAIDRARAYVEAGADVTFVEAPQTVAEICAVPSLLSVPQIINFVEGGKTPILPLDQVNEFAIALFANAALQGAIKGTQTVLSRLRESGLLSGLDSILTPWGERQRLVDKPYFDRLEERYSHGEFPGAG